MKNLSLLFFAVSTSALAALPSVGPDYAVPAAPVPSGYRDPADAGAWKVASPNDAASRGEWWQLFADPALDRLETRALAANQDLQAATARVEQARAAAGLARKVRPEAVFFSRSTSGLARFSTCSSEPVRRRMEVCMYALLHLMW